MRTDQPRPLQGKERSPGSDGGAERGVGLHKPTDAQFLKSPPGSVQDTKSSYEKKADLAF